MSTSLTPGIRLPVRPTARPGDRIRCAPTPPDGCFDFKVLCVCSTAFWQRGAYSRRYSNVVRDLRRMMDQAQADEGEPLDPGNYAAARRWVDQAIAAKHSPLSVVAA